MFTKRKNSGVKDGKTAALKFIKRTLAVINFNNRASKHCKALADAAAILKTAYGITEEQIDNLHCEIAAVRMLRILQKAGGQMTAKDFFEQIAIKYPDGNDPAYNCLACGYEPDVIIRVTRYGHKNPKNRVFKVVKEGGVYG